MNIAVGADHRGYAQKELLKNKRELAGHTIEWVDAGAFDAQRSDYPEYAQLVAQKVSAHEVDCGILLCGTGTGMAMAANRFAAVHAGVAWNVTVAQRCKEEDNVNVLVIPSDFVDDAQMVAMVQAWLTAKFKNGRYEQRIDMIDVI